MEDEALRLDPVYLWYGLLLIYFGIVGAACLVTPGHSASLIETMNSTGQGYHILEVTEEINVTTAPGNEMLKGAILFNNGSTWSVVECNSMERKI